MLKFITKRDVSREFYTHSLFEQFVWLQISTKQYVVYCMPLYENLDNKYHDWIQNTTTSNYGFCWRKTQTPDLTALQVQYRHNLYCQQHRYIIHLYITLCDFKVCDTDEIKFRGYSFSTYALYGLQTCKPTWYIKIMKSLWQQYIDMRKALDHHPPSVRMH